MRTAATNPNREFAVKGPPIPGTHEEAPHPADPQGIVFGQDFDLSPLALARWAVEHRRDAWNKAIVALPASITNAYVAGREAGQAEAYAAGFDKGQAEGIKIAAAEYEKNLPAHLRAAVLRMIHEHEAELEALRSVLAGLPLLQSRDAEQPQQHEQEQQL